MVQKKGKWEGDGKKKSQTGEPLAREGWREKRMQERRRDV